MRDGTGVAEAWMPGRARLPLWPLLLLAMLLAWMVLQLPQPEPAGGRAARFNFELKDGHLLVCGGCRNLMATLDRWRARRSEFEPAAPYEAQRLSGGSLADDVRQALPLYRSAFERAGRSNGLDWQLLAAVGYQESRWNPAAESPTGVRGLMMLTVDTARQLGVDREDGLQSIRGAGMLLRTLYQELPPQIREPDRTAMALAAYNQGIGHLEDARDVAVNRGGDPDHWSDVRAALPLLGDPMWQKTTKYGAARGEEAVAFVDNVRQYYGQLKTLAPTATLKPGDALLSLR
jgi:membrane-bound lytic murein transglycosylase F